MNRSHDATECVLLTGSGRSAIAVVAVTGPQAAMILQDCFLPNHHKPLAAGQVRYGQWNPELANVGNRDKAGSSQTTSADHSAGESVVVLPRFTGQKASTHDRSEVTTGPQTPHSAPESKPLEFEIHCHGGQAAAERIIADLIARGATQRVPHPTEGLPSSLASTDLQEHDQRLIDEATEMLLRCPTAQTAAIALEQSRGALVQWRRGALEHLADNEDAASSIIEQAKRLCQRGAVGQRLDQPWNLVLAGPPNVGKSSLLNAMVGYDRSITMDMPGTTRDVLEAQTVYEGWPIRILDTAGLHLSDQPIERQGIEYAIEAVAKADVVALVLQADSGVAKQQAKLDSHIVDLLGRTNQSQACRSAHHVLWVWNKCDLAGAPQGLPELAGTEAISDDWIETSATKRTGIESLMSRITKHLIEPLLTPLFTEETRVDQVSTASNAPNGGTNATFGPIPVCQRQQDVLAQIAECSNANALRSKLQAL